MPAVAEPQRPFRARQKRSLRNDELLLNVGLNLLATEGWSALSIHRVALDGELSTPTVTSRWPRAELIGAAVWNERAGPSLINALTGVLRACPQPGSTPDANAMHNALRVLALPDAELRAAAELLIVARYDPDLAQAVHESFNPLFGTWLTPVSGRLTRAQAARHAFVLQVALGMLLQDRVFIDTRSLDFTAESGELVAALSTHASPERLPTRRASHLDESPNLATDDPLRADILRATLSVIGELGYERATLQRIALKAKCSTGVIHNRYNSKLEMFLDASARSLATAAILNGEYQRSLALETSVGIADACIVREFMRPEHRALRTVSLEQYRLSWHEPGLYVALLTAIERGTAAGVATPATSTTPPTPGQAYISWARGAGTTLLADLTPESWKLPYDVATVPLAELRINE